MLRPTRYPRLDRPPIVEALLDFAAQFEEAVPAEAFHVDAVRVLGAGAQVSPIQTLEAHFFFGTEDPSAEAGSQLLGYRFQSADGDRVAQFRVDGMTYSVVRSYTSWDELEQGALDAFRSYQDCVGAAVPVRPATRFINRVDIPMDVPLDGYLQALPPVPSGLSFGITAFHTQTQFVADVGLSASLTLASAELLEEADTAAVILDVSVQAQQAFTVGTGDANPAFIAELGRIRDAKNAIFFGSLTPLALSAYQNPEVP